MDNVNKTEAGVALALVLASVVLALLGLDALPFIAIHSDQGRDMHHLSLLGALITGGYGARFLIDCFSTRHNIQYAACSSSNRAS